MDAGPLAEVLPEAPARRSLLGVNDRVDVLRRILGGPLDRATYEDLGVAGWWSRHTAEAAAFERPIARAVAGGFCADRIGWAFLSGYIEALSRLVPGFEGRKLALCVTEQGETHPRQVKTRLEEVEGGFRLTGAKDFVTLGSDADELLVVASIGLDDHDRPRLRMVRVPPDRDGVILDPLPPLDFVPEVPRARVRFEGTFVASSELLPGDGWDDYVKPFRTLEDIHILGAFSGYLLRIGREVEWPTELLERIAAIVIGMFPLAAGAPLDVSTHVALAGIIQMLRREIDELPWDAVPPPVRERFDRDLRLLTLARHARQKRTATAWARLGRL